MVETPRQRRAVRSATTLALTMLLLATAAACNSETATPSPTPEPTSVAAVQAATEVETEPTAPTEPPTVAPTTETEPAPAEIPTVAPNPTTATNPNDGMFTDEERTIAEAEVRAVYTRYLTELFMFDEREGRPMSVDLLNELTVDPLRQLLLDRIADRPPDGRLLANPGSQPNIRSVDFDEFGTAAIVTTCNADFSQVFDADGILVAPLTTEASIVTLTRLDLSGSTWFVSGSSNDQERCDP